MTRGDQPCPVRWKAFLSHGSIKTQLLLLFVKLWQGSKYASCLDGKVLCVAVNNNCFHLSSLDGQTVGSALMDALEFSHEEANTRLLLHVQHAVESQPSSIVIRSPDTDVAVLCCHAQEQIPIPLQFRTGTKQSTRFIDILATCSQLPDGMAAISPALHALTVFLFFIFLLNATKIWSGRPLVVMRQGCSADLNGLGLNTGPVHQVGRRGMDKVGGK